MFETGLCGINSHKLGLVFKGLTGGDTQELETKRNGMVKKKQPTWCTLRLQTASAFRFRVALVQGPCVCVCVCVRARARMRECVRGEQVQEVLPGVCWEHPREAAEKRQLSAPAGNRILAQMSAVQSIHTESVGAEALRKLNNWRPGASENLEAQG